MRNVIGSDPVKSSGQVTASNVDDVARIEARVMVISKLLDATLPRLTPSQCIDVEQAFRDRIEGAMAHIGDIPMPEQYHSELSELTNLYLVALSADRGDSR
nr:hypothetical protein [Paraburkholderia madseniana]